MRCRARAPARPARPAAATVQARAWPGQACDAVAEAQRPALGAMQVEGRGCGVERRVAVRGAQHQQHGIARRQARCRPRWSARRRSGACSGPTDRGAPLPPRGHAAARPRCDARRRPGSRASATRLLPSRPAVASQVCDSRPTRLASSARETSAGRLRRAPAASRLPSRAGRAPPVARSAPSARPRPRLRRAAAPRSTAATGRRRSRASSPQTRGSSSSAKPSRCATPLTGSARQVSTSAAAGICARDLERAAHAPTARSSPASARCSTGRCAACGAPSFMRTRWPNTSPAGVPAMARGTGSAGGRTRSAALASTSRTTSARLATQRRRPLVEDQRRSVAQRWRTRDRDRDA